VLKVSKIILKLSKHQALVTKLIINGRKNSSIYIIIIIMIIITSISMAVRKLYFYQEILIKEYNGIAVGTTILHCMIFVHNIIFFAYTW